MHGCQDVTVNKIARRTQINAKMAKMLQTGSMVLYQLDYSTTYVVSLQGKNQSAFNKKANWVLTVRY